MTNLSTEIQQTEKTISELQPLTDDQIREAVAGGGDAEELIEREETKARRLRVERIKLSDLQRRYSAETQDKAKKEFEKVERQRAQTVEQSSRSLSAMLEAVASLEAAVAEFDELSEKARREFQQMTAHAKGAGLKFPAFGARGPLVVTHLKR